MSKIKAVEYTYVLNYQLNGGEHDLSAIAERLSAEGYKDALVGIGRAGRLTLELACKAPEAEEVVLGAQAAVSHAAPSAKLLSWVRRDGPCASWRWPLWAAIRQQ